MHFSLALEYYTHLDKNFSTQKKKEKSKVSLATQDLNIERDFLKKWSIRDYDKAAY